jgi:DNA-binding transcriptional LysR family regulator
MTVFARVATARSFSAAARELGISQATASKHVQTLENSLGARLLNRTTRRVALTDAGTNFYAQCIRILEDMENAWQAGQSSGNLRGSLRVAAPLSFGSTRLAPVLARFMREYPELSLTVSLTNRPVDVIEERWDLAIRVGVNLPDGQGLSVHRLTSLRFVLCAAPQYLATTTHPATPADLARLACLIDDDPRPDTIWRFRGPNGLSEVAVSGRLRTNSALIRREAACNGTGVMLAPDYMVAEDLAGGRLVRLLRDYTPEEMQVDAVSPADRTLSPRLDRLITFLTEHLAAS